MNIKVFPSKVSGLVNVPASKSIVHRALIAGALSNNYSEIYNVDFNEDILATINALTALGAIINVDGNKISINGFDINKRIDSVKIDAHESGSTLRFLIPLAAFKATEALFTGTNRLMERPLNVYKDIFEKQNLIFKDNLNEKLIKGKLRANNYKVKGDVSSQFISGLLFILPLLNDDSTIEVIAPFESKSYVDLTIDVLSKYNIKIENINNKYFIKGNQDYRSNNITVEGDFSQAAFFVILAAINNDLVINNLNLNSIQGDKSILKILKNLNVKISTKDNSVKVFKSSISSGVIDLSDNPDLGPILCILGLFSDGYIKLTNVKRLRLKESDRLLSMKNQLEKIGGEVEIKENSIKIYKLKEFVDKEVVVDGCNDHRIVMAMSILATVLKKPLIIKGADAVNKSYPNFFKDLNKLWIKTKSM